MEKNNAEDPIGQKIVSTLSVDEGDRFEMKESWKESPKHGSSVKDNMDLQWNKRRISAILIIVCIILIVAVVSTVLVTTGTGVSQASITSLPGGALKSFESTQELYNAVDLWLSGHNTSDSFLALNYGYPIGKWDVSKITDFSNLFSSRGFCDPNGPRNENATAFNEDISTWNVSSATNMMGMFTGAYIFEANLSSWDVSSVTDTTCLFFGASSFHGKGLSEWDVSSVTDMTTMFYGASTFNANLSHWDVSNVLRMHAMFTDAASFTGVGLENWNTSRVNGMDFMFAGAAAFDQDLCPWGAILNQDATTMRIFDDTSRPYTKDPNIHATPPGPFCHACS